MGTNLLLEAFNANFKKGVRGCKKIYVVKAVQDFLHPQSLKMGPAPGQETQVGL